MVYHLRPLKSAVVGRWIQSLTGPLLLAAAMVLSPATGAENVILFIGDGMGFEHVRAARYYQGAALSFEGFPYQAQVTTYSANNSVTDSAASGTAMATGVKVNNGVISMAYPGDGSDLETTLEFHKARGKTVGLITTTYLTHATPATFGAHASDRNLTADIAADYLYQTRPNVLFGGGGNGLTPTATSNAGYLVATDPGSFSTLTMGVAGLISAQFGQSYMPYEYDHLSGSYPYPHLSDMVAKALDELEADVDGFFLMVEGGMIDQASHGNQLERSIHETLEFSRAVQVAFDWASGRSDTLILVTADHETGGLTVTRNNGEGVYPTVTWSTTGHTGVNVPVYAWGLHAALVTGVLDNTDIYRISTGKPIPVTVDLVAAGSTWRFEASGMDLGSAWREPGYDDGAWQSGPAELGYGDGDETTLIPASPVRPTYYFRHTFSIDNPAAYESVSLRILRDDGAVVHLNDAEVARFNMPSGAISYGTWASTAADFGWDPAVLIPNYLVAGENVIAVEVHQANSTSSDVSLDLELFALRTEPDDVAPVIADIVATPDDVTAVIAWTTDEPADSRVDYGLSAEMLGNSAGEPALVTQHSVLLTGLTPAATYTYLISSADGWGNTSVGSVRTFVTGAFINDPPTAPVLSVTAGDGTVQLSWVGSVDPDGDPVSYTVYRDSSTLQAELDVTTYTDTGLENGTAYSYQVSATDGMLWSHSEILIVTPLAPDYTAYVTGNPAVTYGTVSGDFASLRPDADGAQTLNEAKVGQNGLLDVTYELQTVAPSPEISSVNLHLNATYTDYSDALRVFLWNSDSWTDITQDLSDGTCLQSGTVNCVDGDGKIQIRFTDSVAVRKEKLDVLTLDTLYAEITVGPLPPQDNRPPVATDDQASTFTGQTVVIDLLANDGDPDGDPLTISVLTDPMNGVLVHSGDGIVSYTPDPGYVGSDSFTYQVSDGEFVASATVRMIINDAGAGGGRLKVAQILMGATAAGKNWKASAAVSVVDQTGAPAAGAVIHGDWWFDGNPIQAGVSSVADATGVAVTTSTPVRTSDGIFTFQVTTVELAGFEFDSTGQGSASIIVPP